MSAGEGPAGSAGAVLVLNAGSSSIKASLLDPEGHRLWSDQRAWSAATSEMAADAVTADEAAAEEALAGSERGVDSVEIVLQGWLPAALAPWKQQLALVGHRVVHGGGRFSIPTRLTPEVLEVIADLVPLAPLHNGPALRVMRSLQGWRPDLPQWACFDTAFHSTLPPEAFTYAIPAAWRAQGLRRFGFHGLNHQHVAEVVSRRCGGGLRLISCHLGAGCSLCAIADGRSIDTTMGFTPLEGLVMATRSGSIDPGLLLHQLRRGMSVADLDRALNAGSGLLALSERTGSMEELRRLSASSTAEAGNAAARLAIDVFLHRLLQGIGAMAASLGGVDVIALSGGIGEHDGALREELAGALGWLQPYELLVIPADEEGLIARSCRAAMDR